MSEDNGASDGKKTAGFGGPMLRDVAVRGLLWLVFFCCLAPAAIVLRALGRDRLGRRRDAAALSYWRPRSASRAPQSMRKQY